ncbi:hypothetical protein OBBRIDRAFT_889238 [Obba rivulosa]|uniref:HNH nuclease domain-containing protein n=1 Tax=Obba rivulosa TaxID=1052685 RepID=A0A8E2AUD6_9APHY|nr:hypothetical protein OBBRIDRAFT_889238 [Obba rivulosa]
MSHSTSSFCIPASEFEHFSSSCLRWLAYLGLAIAGSEGTLHSSLDPNCPVVNLDDTSSIDLTQSADYYYRHQGNFSPCYPDSEPSTVSSYGTNWASDFRTNVIDRDGRCVIQPDFQAASCKAAHVIRVTHGDDYIKNLTTRRALYSEPFITSIDDIRNGLQINAVAHCHFSKSMAILPIPNPFMDEIHVPSDQLQGYYLQVFDPVERSTQDADRAWPHNERLHTPADSRKWPTKTVFTMSYGAMALKWWGVQDFIDELRREYGSPHYSDDIARDGGHADLAREAEAQKGKKRKQDLDRDERSAKKQEFHQDEPDTMELLYVLDVMLSNGRSHQDEEEMHRRDQRAKENSDKKVEEWLSGMVAA